MSLGFDGFNEASSANIAPQETTGDVSGTLVISGQIDQGSSDNKGMRLDLVLERYSDLEDLGEGEGRGLAVTYWTDADLGSPAFDLALRDIPEGDFEGTLEGLFVLEGDIVGEATLSVDLDGALESDDDGGTRRSPGSTHVVGTATGPSGAVFDIDITR